MRKFLNIFKILTKGNFNLPFDIILKKYFHYYRKALQFKEMEKKFALVKKRKMKQTPSRVKENEVEEEEM